MVCTIGKSAPKQLKFQKPVPFPLQESADSNFHTNLSMGLEKPQHYRLKRTQKLSRAFPPTAHMSLLFLTIYTKLVTSANLVIVCFWAVSRCFMDTKCWISLCLLIMKVYRGRQIHERTLFSYFLVWHAPSSVVVLEWPQRGN